MVYENDFESLLERIRILLEAEKSRKNPSYSEEELKDIFNKTSGHCVYCGIPLLFENYGSCTRRPPRGAWEVEHWIPRARCDSDAACNNPGNLWASCCRCNDEKGTMTGDEYIVWRWDRNMLVYKYWADQLEG